MDKKSAAPARGSGRGPGKTHPDDGERPYGWDFAKALKLARRRIAAAAGIAATHADESNAEPVQRARRRAEAAAPALIDLAQALTLGSDPAALDARRGGVRIMADLAVRQLAMVGLKSSEAIEHDMSDRMAEFLDRFLDPQARARRDADDEPDDGA
jgi:hypothetical protein